jgi:hypothetical protein
MARLTMAIDDSGYYVADERFPPGTRVTIDGFEPGDWHVSHTWPEDVPEYLRGSDSVNIGGRSTGGVAGTAWIHRDRLHAAPARA